MKYLNRKVVVFGLVAAMLGACGDDGGADNDGVANNGGGTNNGGASSGDGGSAGNGGDKDAGSGGGNNGGDGGGGATGNYIVEPSMCGATGLNKILDTSDRGGCYYFYCYTNEEGLRASAGTGACANDTDIAVQCEGSTPRIVAACARRREILAQIGNIDNFKNAITKCAREDAALAEVSDGCLACNVESAGCASKCALDCAMGDSPACDDCREKEECTPDFYKCAGLPNPMEL
jgi:hypothetical protein